jgi:predicted lactoylglutathione lyase
MKQVFINIPVSDLEKSMQFYLALGFNINPLFTDEQQKCMVWSDSIYIMLQTRQFANTYLNKTMIEASKHQIPSFTLPVNSVHEVNEMIESGLLAGGKEPVGSINEGFMYLRSIEDVDGYMWAIMCLDIEKFKALKKNNYYI